MTTYTRDDIILAIEAFWVINGYGPPIRRLAAHLGLPPGNHVSLFRRVENMVNEGILTWPVGLNGKHAANTLRVAPKEGI